MKKLPDNHQFIMPYLIVEGAAKFIEFTQKVFGAKESFRKMRDEKKIMHAEIVISGSTIMFADSTLQYPTQTAGLFIYVEDVDKTYQQALNAGGKSVMEPLDQDHGRTAGITDPCGNTWWLSSVI